MIRLLCFICVVAATTADNVVLNQVVDQALSGLNAAISQAGKGRLPLSDMDHDFPWKKKWISITGQLHCWGGYAENLATIQRTGDVIMATEGNKITLKVALGLGTLSAHYDNCRLKVKNVFQLTQRLDTSVSSNSIEAQATLVKNGDQCTASLDYIRLADLGSIRIDTGGGVFHHLEDRVLEWITRKYKDDVISGVNQVLQEQAAANFPKADLCNKIPH